MEFLQKHLHRFCRIFLNSYTLTPGHTRANSTVIIPTFHPTRTHLPPTTATKNQVKPEIVMDSHLTSTKQDSMLTEVEFNAYRLANLKSISDQKLPLEEHKILREKFENMTYSSWRQKELETIAWGDEHKKQQQQAKDLSSYGF